MKKRLLAVMLSGVMIAASMLAGCGGGAEETEAPATEAAAETEATEAKAEAETQAAEADADSSDPIKIGLVVPLSGDRASEGNFASNAAAIVEQEINDAGGVLGRNIKIEIQDSLGTDVGANNAYLKLAADDEIVAIIAPNNSNDDIAVSDSAEASEILTTVQGSSPTLQTICEEGQWLFQLRATDPTLCDVLMDYAINEVGAKTFTIIHDTETASSDQANLFKAAIEEKGATVDELISFTNGTKDFTAQLTKAQQNDSDAIIMACLYTEGAILIQQTRAMGIEKPVFGTNAFGDPITIDLAGEAINGVYSATAWVPDAIKPEGKEFSEKYTETYGEDCSMNAAQARDHIYTICAAIEAAGTTDRVAVRDAMLTLTNQEGIITTYDCSRRGNCALGGLVVQVQDGTATVIQEIS